MSLNRSRMATASRTARAAWSAWRTGSLKKTMIPSPAKCSSVPSWATMSAPIVAWYRRRKPRTSSGSAVSENVVKLRRSQNIAVISRRWPASIASPSGLETSAATCGDRNRASWARWRSIVPSSGPLLVAQPLLAERRRDPRPEDRRVDGLGEVVGGAHADAADDAVELVDAGDDDDRQVAQGRVGLERGERLVAVHLGHDDVEQDRRRPAASPGRAAGRAPPAVGGLERLVADPAEQPDEQLAVERRVVDDEDPPGQGVRSTLASRGSDPGVAGRSCRCAWLSSSGRIGFET